MAHRDDVLSPSTAERPVADADARKERATPHPTVLSTLWEGPSDVESGAADDGDPPADVGVTSIRSRVIGWLLAPVTRRRALIITAVAAAACGGVLAVGGADKNIPESSTAPTDGSDERVPNSSESGVREAVSADERIRVTATAVQTAGGGWMLEAHVIDMDVSDPTVRFTVNGAVIEQVERSPYRLLLTDELLASFPSAVGDGQPLIVTASAVWAGGGDAASPATLVLLPN